MNIEALKKTRDLLARSQTYDQSTWVHDGTEAHPCGTPACVAGHIMAAHSDGPLDPEVSTSGDAAALADLSSSERELMFQQNPYRGTRNATKDDALAMLDHAIEHQEVKWP